MWPISSLFLPSEGKPVQQFHTDLVWLLSDCMHNAWNVDHFSAHSRRRRMHIAVVVVDRLAFPLQKAMHV